MKTIMKVQLKCCREMLLHEKTYEEYMKHVEVLPDEMPNYHRLLNTCLLTITSER